MKLYRDFGISQKSAWHLAHRIRQCWDDLHSEPFEGPVEADVTYVGGLAKNMHAKVRRQRIHGRGGVDKTAVAGLRDRPTARSRRRWWRRRTGRRCGGSSPSTQPTTRCEDVMRAVLSTPPKKREEWRYLSNGD